MYKFPCIKDFAYIKLCELVKGGNCTPQKIISTAALLPCRLHEWGQHIEKLSHLSSHLLLETLISLEWNGIHIIFLSRNNCHLCSSVQVLRFINHLLWLGLLACMVSARLQFGMSHCELTCQKVSQNKVHWCSRSVSSISWKVQVIFVCDSPISSTYIQLHPVCLLVELRIRLGVEFFYGVINRWNCTFSTKRCNQFGRKDFCNNGERNCAKIYWRKSTVAILQPYSARKTFNRYYQWALFGRRFDRKFLQCGCN